MKIGLTQAATLLGKTQRQIRYLIKTGGIRATKESGRWQIDSTALPLSEAQRSALGQRVTAAREAFDASVATAETISGTKPRGKRKRAYSVTNLRVFTIGCAIYVELTKSLAREEACCVALMRSLKLIARGCHTYYASDEAWRYFDAREAAADALVELLAGVRDEPRRAAAVRVERELLPLLGRLIATNEQRVERARPGGMRSQLSHNGRNDLRSIA